MARLDFNAPRLFCDAPFAEGVRLAPTVGQEHYLRHVLRLKEGEAILVFNGADGEWRARLAPEGRKGLALALEERVRPQEVAGDLVYLFAPLKSARLDYMVQKAVEMGASRARHSPSAPLKTRIASPAFRRRTWRR